MQKNNNYKIIIKNQKDKEMEIVEEEERLNQLKDKIGNLNELVLEKHREALSWETQYKMVEETLQWRKDQNARSSELNMMRAEIHRMQIRHQQLKRAQNKLMQDLEHTIIHRETIFTAATQRSQKNSKLSQSKAPSTVQSQVSDVRNKMKQNEVDTRQLHEDLQTLTKEYEHLQSETNRLHEELESTKSQQKEIVLQIDEAQLQKYTNIELIVREQNRVKAYEKLAKSAAGPRITCTESSLELQKLKAHEFNDNLQEVVQNLIDDFPAYGLQLKKLLNLLKL